MSDPDTRLVRRTHHGAAFLGYQASVLTENRHGLIVQTDVRSPSGYAEREAALAMVRRLPRRRRRRTLGADKGYDTPDFIAGVRALGFTPHVSPNQRRIQSGAAADPARGGPDVSATAARSPGQPDPARTERGRTKACSASPRTLRSANGRTPAFSPPFSTTW